MLCHGSVITGLLVLLTGLPSGLLAAETSGYTLPLFADGQLDHWVLENGAEVDFVDGCLRFKGGDGWLRSPHQYRDFELHVEWKALQETAYDAGIYIRAAADGKPFPKPSYQINLLQGKEGNISSLPGAASTGLVKPGDWNSFDIRVIGDRVSLRINGQPAYDVSGLQRLQGYVGFQIEVPKGGQFLVRNVSLTELGFESLFNGRDLTGWAGADAEAAKCWSVIDGLLVCSGEKGPWLRSDREWSDFSFRVEYLLSDGGNSGVYVRVPKNGNHHRAEEKLPAAGFEVQMLDDAAPKHANLKDYQYSASVYDISGASPRNTRPPGAWNTMEINCAGQHVTVMHNGAQVVNITAETHPLLALRQTAGFLGLQNHSTVVKFRHVRIGKPLEY